MRTIGVVEDQQAGVGFDPSGLFTRLGWAMISSHLSVAAAEEAARADPGTVPSVVITDLYLGDRPSGAAAVHRLLALTGSTGVHPHLVITSATLRSRSVTDAWAAGALSFVSTGARAAPTLWGQVLDAADQGRARLTSALAAHLSRDRFQRPLQERDELTPRANALLDRALDSGDVGDPMLGYPADHHDSVIEEIRRTAARRSAAYRLNLSPKGLLVAKLVSLSVGQDQIGNLLGVTPATTSDYLRKIKYAMTGLGVDRPQSAAAREAWAEWCAQECLPHDWVPPELERLICATCAGVGAHRLACPKTRPPTRVT